jgi:hypothetical protein
MLLPRWKLVRRQCSDCSAVPSALPATSVFQKVHCPGLSTFYIDDPAVGLPNHTARAHPGRLGALSVSNSKLILYGTFVWAHRTLNIHKRRFSARAATAGDIQHGLPRLGRPEGRDPPYDGRGRCASLNPLLPCSRPCVRGLLRTSSRA